MSDATKQAEKFQEDHVETILRKDVPTPSSADEAAAAAQDDLLEVVSVSTFMAIFVSSDLPTHISFPLTSPLSSSWVCLMLRRYPAA